MKSITAATFPAILLLTLVNLFAGVSSEIEREYRAKYENRALFLKLPVRGERSVIYLRGEISVIDPSSMGQPLRFKVGEQIRITRVDFDNTSVKFRLASIDLSQEAELIFRFSQELTYSFAQREEFDAALAESFTEGLTYRDIDRAKEQYVKDQFGRIINQFAITTGLEPDTIIEAVLESTPDYANTQEELNSARTRLERIEKELEESRQARQQLESSLTGVRNELSETDRASSALREQRDRLAQEKRTLEKELSELKAANERFIRELESATSQLDLQNTSQRQLGSQVENLSLRIDALLNEQASLTSQVGSLTQELESVRSERDDLSDQLRTTERRRQALQTNLNSLTSDRNSLEANFLRIKEEKESLETARAIGDAINLKRLERIRDNGVRQLSEVYLQTQKLGSFTVSVPNDPSASASIQFTADSPNLVQFNEEERQLYEALGEKLSIAAQWRSESGNLNSVLVSGTSSQTLAPREEALWEWKFQGNPQGVESIVLELFVEDENGNTIPLDTQEFEMGSGSILSSFQSDFSLLWLVVGVVAGAAALGLAVMVRDRSRSKQRRGPVRRNYSAQKKM